MMEALRRPIIWILFGVTVAYWIAAQFVISRRMIVLMDSMVVTTALAVMVVYSKALIGRLSSDNPTAFDMMIIGITGSWLVNAIDRGIRMVARGHRERRTDKPPLPRLPVGHAGGVRLLPSAGAQCGQGRSLDHDQSVGGHSGIADPRGSARFLLADHG